MSYILQRKSDGQYYECLALHSVFWTPDINKAHRIPNIETVTSLVNFSCLGYDVRVIDEDDKEDAHALYDRAMEIVR